VWGDSARARRPDTKDLGQTGMPDTSRRKGGSHRAHPRRGGFLAVLATLLGLFALAPSAAWAFGLSIATVSLDPIMSLNAQEFAALTVALGVLVFSITMAVLMMRLRMRAAAAQTGLGDNIIALRAERDRFATLLLAEPQILVTWAASGGEPEIIGDTTLIT